MRFDEVRCFGPLYLERLSALTTWTSDDQNRLVLIEDSTNSTYELYLGDQTKWRRLDFPIEDLTGDDIFVAYDGTNLYLTKALPNQTGHAGKFLKTDGSADTDAEWVKIVPDDILPSQSGQNAKFLQTDGSTLSWNTTPSELEPKAGHEGKVLVADTSTTTGTNWEDISEAMGLPSKVGHATEFLQVTSDETEVAWNDPFPTYSGTADQYLKVDSLQNRSWVDLNTIPDPSVRSVLMTDGSTIEWNNSYVLPDQTNNEGNVLVTDGANLSWTDITDKFWISSDTTWNVPSDYATIQLAITALDNYYIHPKATLTILLANQTHNIATPVSITNRGKGEGLIVIKGIDVDNTIITSSDFGAFNFSESFFSLWSSKVRFQNLTITGNILSTTISGITGLYSFIELYSVKINNFTGAGLSVNWQSQGYVTGSTITGCLISNLQSANNSNLLLYDTTSTASTGNGIEIIGARAYINGCTISSNLRGVYCRNGGSFKSANETSYTSNHAAAIITNGSNGDFVEYVGSSYTKSNFDNNGVTGITSDIQVLNHSFADLSYIKFSGSNGPYEVYVNGLSFVRTYNSDSITTTSPTLNTSGNINSYISSSIYL